MAATPEYQRIISLGPPVVPLTLAEMRDRPGHWFYALAAITGANPYTPEREGGFVKFNVPEATEAWLNWGRENGLIG